MSKSSTKKRKPSCEWARRTNYVPLVERGAFQLRKLPITFRLNNAGKTLDPRSLIKRLPGIRIIIISESGMRSVSSRANRYREARCLRSSK